MNSYIISLICGVIGYVVGSIPSGYLIVKAATGTDIRTHGSGRTGGTNAYRAAGVVAGILTAVLDIGKGLITVLLIRSLGLETGGLAESLAGLGVILGHNKSLFLKFAGGAGGATAVGTGFAFSFAAGMVAMLLGTFMWLVIGYASLATILASASVAIVTTILAINGSVPSTYPIYGWGALILCLIALRPNLKRLLDGTEKRVDILKLRSKNK
ncbi:MAG: glycerol-3-phosphate acyltransferase [Chloroflexota bacterium]|jgi:glycerol-3-phosphate acyltransferase PlsY|nr:glycerol-3-phosphate acyltransferase [Chloroflexota bacterium]